jgi:hypothetical protein
LGAIDFRNAMTSRALSLPICALAAVAISLDFNEGPNRLFYAIMLLHAAMAAVPLFASESILSRFPSMKLKFVPAALYATTAFSVAADLDSLYGAGPLTNSPTRIHLAVAGAALFALAFLLSLVKLRLGIVCGFIAGIVSWPLVGIEMAVIPWTSLPGVLPLAHWSDILAAVLMLTVSSAYSLVQARFLFATAEVLR